MNTHDNNRRSNHFGNNSMKQNFQTNRTNINNNNNNELNTDLFFDLNDNKGTTSHSNYRKNTTHEKKTSHAEKRSRHYEQPQNNNAKRNTSSKNGSRKKQTRRQQNKRKRKIRFIQRITIIMSLLILFLLLYFVKTHKSIIPSISTQTDYTSNIEKILAQTTGNAASVSKYYVYGTHFNLEGTITAENKTIKSLSLVLMDEKTGVLASDEVQTVTSAKTSQTQTSANNIKQLTMTTNSDGTIGFTLSTKINEGINLENITNGSYCILLKEDFDDGSSSYKSLENTQKEENITYYTITKDNSNQKVSIQFDKIAKTQTEYLEFKVQKASLPDNVYDIVIDAGHGGTDTGAISGKYTEAQFTLAYAKALYKSLTSKGYKVKLTRDGSESSSTKMAYTMYDKDGRVNIANASGAKYCFCLHLNSNEQKLTKGGVQVYTSYRGNTDFAKLIADNIVKEANTTYSVMETDKTADGVYQRPYTTDEITSSKNAAVKGKYNAYPITTDTDYLFMIRELGGIATNAYIDGRNTKYGKNLYYKSNKGVECFLIELGYISIDKDLKNILSNKAQYVKAISDSLDEQMQTLEKE